MLGKKYINFDIKIHLTSPLSICNCAKTNKQTNKIVNIKHLSGKFDIIVMFFDYFAYCKGQGLLLNLPI